MDIGRKTILASGLVLLNVCYSPLVSVESENKYWRASETQADFIDQRTRVFKVEQICQDYYWRGNMIEVERDCTYQEFLEEFAALEKMCDEFGNLKLAESLRATLGGFVYGLKTCKPIKKAAVGAVLDAVFGKIDATAEIWESKERCLELIEKFQLYDEAVWLCSVRN